MKKEPSEEMKEKVDEARSYLRSAFMYDPFFDWKLSTILLEKRPKFQELIESIYDLFLDGFRQFNLGNYRDAVKALSYTIQQFPEFTQSRFVRGLA